MSRSAGIVHVPRPSRVSASVAARVGPAVIDPECVEAVLSAYGLRLDGASRNLRLGRRSRNVAVRTDRGHKVVKLYRPQWTAATVEYAHSIIGELESRRFPVPPLVRSPQGTTWVTRDGGHYAVFDFIPGKNYSLQFLLREDRLRLTLTAGVTLARLHRTLEGFVPAGRHHLGFASLSGERHRNLPWYEGKVAELAERSLDLPSEEAELGRQLRQRAGELLEGVGRLDTALSDVGLPRLVIHGDYGLHNLLFQSAARAVPLDYELSRLDWRVNDLISALVKHRYNGGRYDFESMRVLLGAYARTYALTREEQRHFVAAWRLYKLQAAVQYWNSYFETSGPIRKLVSALDAIGQAEWVAEHAGLIEDLVADGGGATASDARAAGSERPAGATDGSAPAPQLTVLQVTPNLDVGGAQETVCTLAKYLRRTGCPTLVLSFRDGPLGTDLERQGVPLELVPERRRSVVALPLFLYEMVQRRRDLLAVIARHDVDVVQTQGCGILDFLVMTLGRRVQVWWTIQNASFTLRPEHVVRHRWLLRPKQLAHRLLYRIGARVVDGVIAVSDETARAFREVANPPAGKVSVVCNAVDAERYPASVDREELRTRLGFAPSDHVMVMVGTFKRQKGHQHLVEAVAGIEHSVPQLRVLLVGDGALRQDVEAQVEQAGLSDRLTFAGTRRDVPAILAASDSFVLPSLWEGLPVALVEAMASGLPVIATAVSGTSQVMRSGVTGWVVPPGDAPALGAAISELLHEPDRARRMAVAGRQRVVERFGAQEQAKQLAVLFRTRRR